METLIRHLILNQMGLDKMEDKATDQKEVRELAMDRAVDLVQGLVLVRFGDPGGRTPANKEDEKEKPPAFKPKPNSGVTTGLNILDKPRPIYTDAARENGVQGTVTLRVTFNANGTIGSIVAISGLPHGLTEQAIAAAKNIKFEPIKRNGVAQTTSKQIAYSFILY